MYWFLFLDVIVNIDSVPFVVLKPNLVSLCILY